MSTKLAGSATSIDKTACHISCGMTCSRVATSKPIFTTSRAWRQERRRAISEQSKEETIRPVDSQLISESTSGKQAFDTPKKAGHLIFYFLFAVRLDVSLSTQSQLSNATKHSGLMFTFGLFHDDDDIVKVKMRLLFLAKKQLNTIWKTGW